MNVYIFDVSSGALDINFYHVWLTCLVFFNMLSFFIFLFWQIHSHISSHKVTDVLVVKSHNMFCDFSFFNYPNVALPKYFFVVFFSL